MSRRVPLGRQSCLWCGTLFQPSKVGQKYHADGCRKAAWKNRNMVAARMSKCDLTSDEKIDLKTLKSVSGLAADFVLQVCAVMGREMGAAALDAIWDFAGQAGLVVSDGVFVYKGGNLEIPF